jgi:hypothetical protein
MKNGGWVLLGIAGLILATANKAKAGIDAAVDILKSIAVTFDREGVWQPESAAGQRQDKGNYYPQTGANRTYYGTNYGVTAQFLVDYQRILKIPLSNKDVVKNLTQDQARWIFETIIGNRMRYNSFTNQFLANFVFDWMVQRPSTCIWFMCVKIYGWTEQRANAEINRAAYSDELLQNILNSDPSVLYNSLKFWRLWHLTYTDTYISFRKGVYNRIVKFSDFPETKEVEDMKETARKKAFG